MRIWIHLYFNADPAWTFHLTFHSNADPDPAAQNIADPDPQPCFKLGYILSFPIKLFGRIMSNINKPKKFKVLSKEKRYGRLKHWFQSTDTTVDPPFENFKM
jgi:hypothetical protein